MEYLEGERLRERLLRLFEGDGEGSRPRAAASDTAACAVAGCPCTRRASSIAI